MTWLLLTAAATFVACFALARYQHTARLRDWQGFLSHESRSLVSDLEAQTTLDGDLLASAYDGARSRRNEAPVEAVRLLRCTCDFVTAMQPERIGRLRAVLKLTRMAAAILPAPPVLPSTFHLAELQGLTALGTLAHALLVTPAERFLLHLQILILGFGLALRSLGRSTARARSRPFDAVAWARFERGLEDWRTLDLKHVDATKHVLLSLGVLQGDARAGAVLRS